MQYRFINLENYARECATKPNTITFIIDNACRVFPCEKVHELIKMIEDQKHMTLENFLSDTKALHNDKPMPGLAILLFAIKKTAPATDIAGNNNTSINTGTDNFIKHVTQCLKQKKYGFEFLNLYPESMKIMYSDRPLSDFTHVKLFKEPE
jgi:hypothetical protein